MSNVKAQLIEYYNSLCKRFNKKLTSYEYRNSNPKYSLGKIEKHFGTWNKFLSNVANVDHDSKLYNDKIVISYALKNHKINKNFVDTLKNYCKINKAELAILTDNKLGKLDESIERYCKSSFSLAKDKSYIVADLNIKINQNNPLVNLEKITTEAKNIIVGSVKQYLKVLPYKQGSPCRLAMSTGTVSIVNYGNNVKSMLNRSNHCFGAILLEFNKDLGKYICRNLIFKEDKLHDLDKMYTTNNVKSLNQAAGIVLGDLHFPEEDYSAFKNTKSIIKKINPAYIICHDIASWNSISHHEQNKRLDKLKSKYNCNNDLNTELSLVVSKINAFINEFKKSNFVVVASNHDDFIEKWLNQGEFIKDRNNARIGAELFIDYLENKHILCDKLSNNIRFLNREDILDIEGYIVSEHGDTGISGAKGSAKSFSKVFNKSITAHTHSPEIYENTITVGTLSKLNLGYNCGGLTKWVHANVIIHKNGTFQLIFV